MTFETVPNSPGGRLAVTDDYDDDRPAVGRKRDPQRSAVSNGTRLLPGIDGRSAWCRRLKDCFADHLSDVPNASVAEMSILRRAATLTVELERLEAKFALEEQASPADLDLYQRGASALRRLLESVHAGLERRPRDVGVLEDQEEFRRIIGYAAESESCTEEDATP
jgi:hypothetical protein